MVKIRLQRHGRKKKPYYHIVAADVRSKRDGRIIEDLGRYDPVNATTKVTINTDRVIHWLTTGAQPTDTVRSILKKEGIMYRIHLMGWGKSEEEINATLEAWKASKGGKKSTSVADDMRSRLKAEEESYKKSVVEKAKAAEEAKAAAAAAAAKAEAAAAEAPAEEAAAEAAAEVAEAPAEEVAAEEAPAEAPAESAEGEEAKEA